MKNTFIVEFVHKDGERSYLSYNEDWYNVPYTTSQKDAHQFDSHSEARDAVIKDVKILNKNINMNIISCNICEMSFKQKESFTPNFFD